MAEPSFLDPSPFGDFPQFHHPFDPAFSDDPALFADACYPLPERAASDLDLDGFDLDLEFSVDDLLLPAPESCENGSKSCSNLTTDSNSNSHPGSPDSGHSAAVSRVVEVKREEEESNSRRKRKPDDDDPVEIPKPDVNPNPKPDTSPNCSTSSRSLKIRRSDEASSPSTFSAGADEDEKRKARLMRNRESAQLSRQRKRHYVEELEEKVKMMNSTIVDLNGKISFYMAENARLHQQLNGNGNGNANANANGGKENSGTPPVVYPPLPPAPYHFPWIPYPGYAMRSGGHSVPYVPIPRLKPQQPASAPKAKKSESKKSETRTKKVASVSLLGLLLIMMLFGGVVNFGLGRAGDVVHAGGVSGGSGRILSVKGRGSGLNNTHELKQLSGTIGTDSSGHDKMYQKAMEGVGSKQNSSESLPALLYVPRNGKHVEINGNLIIHSVLASERAVAQAKSKGNEKQSAVKESTGLAIPGRHLTSALVVPKGSADVPSHSKACRDSDERTRALPSDYHEKYGENMKSTISDGPLQQWFREGLAGPILSSGTCTEVFQFEVSPSSDNPNGIIPAPSSVVNATDKLPRGNIRNRRIMRGHPIPLNGSTLNNGTQQRYEKPSESSTGFPGGNNSSIPSSMVVSVLADPREAGDGDSDRVIRPKSLSRIFVVVLRDSVKYVTYSCVLPLKNHGPHLVN